MSALEGKVAVVTGGATGIGLATARRFVAEGATVFITGRREAELKRAVESIGPGVIAVQGDVSVEADLHRLHDHVKDQAGVIDIIVANSGIVDVVQLEDVTRADFDRIFDINVKGVFFSVQTLLPLMRDGGSIILNASIGASKARRSGFSLYGASKAAVRSFARTWTVDLKSRGIRVNAISPGYIETPLIDSQLDSPTDEASRAIRDNFSQGTPLGRMGRADEVAAAILFLASEEASYITAIELFIDGGVAQI